MLFSSSSRGRGAQDSLSSGEWVPSRLQRRTDASVTSQRTQFGRGSSRGNGYGPRRGGFTKTTSIPTSPSPPLGQLIQSISASELSSGSSLRSAESRLTGCELVASYNWMDKEAPSISIPGMPPRWSPLPAPRQLEEDSGTYYRDTNASRFPDHPLEPAIQAVLEMSSKQSFADIDIVACGSTLGNLLRFVRGEPRGFRMLVEVIGKAVHLIRRENSPKEIIPDVYGYGHTFPEAYTSWDSEVGGSASNQRIVWYRFGGMTCLVRFESDGYLPDKAGSLAATSKPQKSSGPEKDSLESLTSALAAAPISSKTPDSGQDLHKSLAGRPIPQSAVFDLKTRSARRRLDPQDVLADELPRLWLAQIPNFILAFHDRGTFNEIKVQDVRADVSRWESDHEAELAQFAALLRRLVDLARTRSDGKLEINREEGVSRIQIRMQMPGLPSAFSGETEKRWREHLGTSHSKRDEEKGSSGAERSDSDDDFDDFYADDGFRYDSDDFGREAEDFTACSLEDCGYCGRCMY